MAMAMGKFQERNSEWYVNNNTAIFLFLFRFYFYYGFCTGHNCSVLFNSSMLYLWQLLLLKGFLVEIRLESWYVLFSLQVLDSLGLYMTDDQFRILSAR